MSAPAATRETPTTHEEAAAVLRRCAGEGTAVCPVGGATKLGWGKPAPPTAVELSTARLDGLLEHNEGDLTAVLGAGIPFAKAQAAFAEAGQMFALDPPLGPDDAATVGGVIASADTGPLRHRYGAGRDLAVGMTMALSDGTVARSGSKVIKNVAGYDLAKLFAGSFGTLGLILELTVRLHPRADARLTARGAAGDPDVLGRAAAALAHSHLEMEALDASWAAGSGSVLARFAGAAASDQAQAALSLLAEAGTEASVVEDDTSLWQEQRDGQRSREGAVVRVSGLAAALPRVARAAEAVGASLVSRAALGVSWLRLDGASASEIDGLRATLAPFPCVLLDGPAELRGQVDVWDERDPARLALTRRVKERFDPAGVMSPGTFVGGI